MLLTKFLLYRCRTTPTSALVPYLWGKRYRWLRPLRILQGFHLQGGTHQGSTKRAISLARF
jgi:hypothetical protein